MGFACDIRLDRFMFSRTHHRGVFCTFATRNAKIHRTPHVGRGPDIGDSGDELETSLAGSSVRLKVVLDIPRPS